MVNGFKNAQDRPALQMMGLARLVIGESDLRRFSVSCPNGKGAAFLITAIQIWGNLHGQA